MKIDPVLGIEVVFDEGLANICDSRGIFRWKKIVVGPTFLSFPPREQQALLLHEVGHCKLKHLEKRLARLWLLFWSPRRLAEMCIEQEFEADRFVAAIGLGGALAQAFGRIKATPDPFHPPVTERIARLIG